MEVKARLPLGSWGYRETVCLPHEDLNESPNAFPRRSHLPRQPKHNSGLGGPSVAGGPVFTCMRRALQVC